jgi:hypothetical protein
MVVLPILHDQNKIKVRCNIEMWVLHDGSTPTCKYGTNMSIASMINDRVIWMSKISFENVTKINIWNITKK